MPQFVASGPAMRSQMFSEFASIYFPQSIDTSYNLDVWHYLISSFSALPKKTQMLDKAIAALCCFYLGKLRNDKRLFHHGIQLYNSAIRHLSTMMSQNNYCDDIVYTTIVFQEIEVLSPSPLSTVMMRSKLICMLSNSHVTAPTGCMYGSRILRAPMQS